MTREFFAQNQVQFTEIDIEKSPVGRKQYEAAGGTGGVPLIDVNGEVIRGFNQAALKMKYEALQPILDVFTQAVESGQAVA